MQTEEKKNLWLSTHTTELLVCLLYLKYTGWFKKEQFFYSICFLTDVVLLCWNKQSLVHRFAWWDGSMKRAKLKDYFSWYILSEKNKIKSLSGVLVSCWTKQKPCKDCSRWNAEKQSFIRNVSITSHCLEISQNLPSKLSLTDGFETNNINN